MRNENVIERYELFCKVLDSIKEGMSITFTPNNVASGNDFLIFSAYKSCTVTFKRSWNGIWYVEFDNDEPMLLEDCPESFYRSILKNIK